MAVVGHALRGVLICSEETRRSVTVTRVLCVFFVEFGMLELVLNRDGFDHGCHGVAWIIEGGRSQD